MFKTKRITITESSTTTSPSVMYDTYFDKINSATKKMMFRLVFALAMSVKISPKTLASYFTVEEMEKYAREFNSELIKRSNEEVEAIKKEVESVVR